MRPLQTFGLGHVVLTVTVLGVVGMAAGQAVLFEDDFDRGWENAMTHAFLPGWSNPMGTFIPSTDATYFDVELDVN